MSESDFNLKVYLEEKFKHVEDRFVNLEKRIDESNINNISEIEKLRENDRDHYNLDKEHRSVCQKKAESLKDDMQDSLSNFGERLGKSEGKIEANKEEIKDLKNILLKKENNFQSWAKSLLPYAIVAVYIIVQYMKGEN